MIPANGIKKGDEVILPSGKRARVTSLVEAGYRANLVYVPDIPVLGRGDVDETVSLPVRLLKAAGKK